jgi:alkanesulfonate monooxygenase SsuD/methylene tetrahydromethanopterin reductase-like flavin-dependent oxidoreductase (luciferase family)
MDIDFGVLIPISKSQWGAGTDPRVLIDFAIRAERLGFDSLWVNDSLASPRIEALTMLAAAAPVTERVTLGTAALLPVLRRPVQAAQTLASIDLLSGGRLVVAVGAGFPGRLGQPMYELSGVPWQRRFARLDETVALWRQLWAGATSFQGEFLQLPDIPPATLPYRDGGPPIWLGGATPAALRRAGRLYDGWLPYPPDPADYEAGLAHIRAAADGAGRDAAAVSPALFISVLIAASADAGRSALADYTLATYGMPLAEVEKIQALATGTALDVTAALERYIAAGARHIVCRIAAVDLASIGDQLEQLAELAQRVRASSEATASSESGGRPL